MRNRNYCYYGLNRGYAGALRNPSILWSPWCGDGNRGCGGLRAWLCPGGAGAWSRGCGVRVVLAVACVAWCVWLLLGGAAVAALAVWGVGAPSCVCACVRVRVSGLSLVSVCLCCVWLVSVCGWVRVVAVWGVGLPLCVSVCAGLGVVVSLLPCSCCWVLLLWRLWVVWLSG